MINAKREEGIWSTKDKGRLGENSTFEKGPEGNGRAGWGNPIPGREKSRSKSPEVGVSLECWETEHIRERAVSHKEPDHRGPSMVSSERFWEEKDLAYLLEGSFCLLCFKYTEGSEGGSREEAGRLLRKLRKSWCWLRRGKWQGGCWDVGLGVHLYILYTFENV